MSKILIKNGRIIDPENKIDAFGDLLIENSKIVKVGTVSDDLATDAQVIDATGKIVAPGLIDIHVHTREPGFEDKETIATCSEAAVAGGFSTICCMPNTKPALDNDTAMEYVTRQSEAVNLARVLPTGCITKERKGEELAEMALMSEAGAVAFTDDGSGIRSSKLMQRALQYAAMLGRPIMQHCEDADLFGGAMNAGPLAVRLGLGGIPNACEEIMLQRDITLLNKNSTGYHAQHISTKGSIELIRNAKQRGLNVSAEATPHHLLLTDASCMNYDSNFKMNPPLRTFEDVQALRAAVADGTIECLATDHAPHTAEDKQLEFALAPFGIIGLECALGLYAKALVESGACDWPTLIERMTAGPAKIINSDLGTLGEGRPADVTIIDPQTPWTVDVEEFKSKSRNCPWNGWKLNARATTTIVAGKIKFSL